MLTASFCSPMALGSVCSRSFLLLGPAQRSPGNREGLISTWKSCKWSSNSLQCDSSNTEHRQPDLSHYTMPLQHLSQDGHDRHQAAITQGPKFPQGQAPSGSEPEGSCLSSSGKEHPEVLSKLPTTPRGLASACIPTPGQ